jgi:hypothetical protein
LLNCRKVFYNQQRRHPTPARNYTAHRIDQGDAAQIGALMQEHGSSQFHRTVARVNHAATLIVDHRDHVGEPLWRRLFEVPLEPSLIDVTRHFVAALDEVMGTPAVELSRQDVATVEKHVNQVVDRLELRIDAMSDSKEAVVFATAIYILRARFEKIAARGEQHRDDPQA